MAAYVNLPWMPESGMFLRAMEAGAQRANSIASLRQQANRDRLSAQKSGGGGGFSGGGGVDPYTAARTAALLSQTALAEQAAADEATAFAENERLQSIGMSPEEAYSQTGLNRFGAPALKSQTEATPKTYEVGNRVVRINPVSGQAEVVFEAPTTPTKEPTFKIPMMKDLMGRAETISMTPTQLRATLDTLPEFARTNAITQAVLNMPGAGTTNAPVAALTERKAVGGYKIGAVYSGGLKYLGGDPNDEGSWQKVR